MYYFISNDDYYYSTNGGVKFIKKNKTNLISASRFRSKQSAAPALSIIMAAHDNPKGNTAKALAICGADPSSFRIEEWPEPDDSTVKLGEVSLIPERSPDKSFSALEFRDNLMQTIMDRISFTEFEQQDILHIIENGHIDAVKISKISKRLKEVREERRILKDMHAALCGCFNSKEDITYNLRTHVLDDILGITTKETD